MRLNVIDIVVICSVLVSTVVGYVRGLLREVLSIASILAASFISIKFAPYMFAFVTRLVGYEASAKIVSYVVCFVLAIISCSICTHFICLMFHKTSCKSIDRLFGMLFGFVRGILCCCAMEIVATSIIEKANVFDNSVVLPYIQKTSNIVILMLPQSMSEYIVKSVKESRWNAILSGVNEDIFKDNRDSVFIAKKMDQTNNKTSNTDKNLSASAIAHLGVKKEKAPKLTKEFKQAVDNDISSMLIQYSD